jgi:hypothetical protein
MPEFLGWYVVVSIDGDAVIPFVMPRLPKRSGYSTDEPIAKEQVLFRIWLVQTATSAANALSSEIVRSLPVLPADLGVPGIKDRYLCAIDLATFDQLEVYSRYTDAPL